MAVGPRGERRSGTESSGVLSALRSLYVTGATLATEATVSTIKTKLDSLAQKTQLPAALVGGKLSVTDPTALPLPAGASTSALQTSGGQKTQITDSSGNAVAVVDAKLRTLDMPYGYGIAEGIVTGHTKWKVIGFRSALPTGETHFALGATGRFAWPAVAQVFYLVSSSTNDDGSPAGTGAQTIYWSGIKADGTVGTETVTLDGTTQVATAGQYLAPVINDTYVSAAGALGANAGTITCHSATPGTSATVVWAMTVGTNQASGSVYMVPATKTARLIKVLCGEASTQGTTTRLYTQAPGSLFRRMDVYQVDGNSIFDEFLIPHTYTAGTRIEVTGQAVSGTAVASVKFLGWLE